MTPETKLKNQILAYLKRLKADGEPIWWYKVHGSRYQMAGVPDLDIVYKGLAIKLEIKAGNEQPTKLQEHVMDEIRNARTAPPDGRAIHPLRYHSGTTSKPTLEDSE